MLRARARSSYRKKKIKINVDRMPDCGNMSPVARRDANPNQTENMKTTKQYQDIRQHAIDKLRDGVGAGDAGDLHHYLFNEDYFIIGTFQAKEWLGSEVFEAIETIRQYEQGNFGEVNTDFSDPAKVANMLAYILGEEILQESETLQDKWNEQLEEADLLAIAEELES